MEMKCGRMLLALAVVVVFTALCPVFTGSRAVAAGAFSAAELKQMGTFLSNFTEQGLMEFTAADLLQAKNPVDAVQFGIRHNSINNFKSRIVPCKTKDCKWGSLSIDGKHVAETIKKYFGVDFKPAALSDSERSIHYDGRVYHFEGADGEATYYARVLDASRTPDGKILMSGELYNADDETDVNGTFKAVARPHTFNGKKTWAIETMEGKR